MRSGSAFLIALTVLASWQSVSCAQGPPIRMPAEQGPKNYASPNAVFDAYREANARNDIRRQLLCLTPEIRADSVYEALLACHTSGRPQAVALLKTFDVETYTLVTEYQKQYRAIHGKEVPPSSETDEALLRKVLRDKVPDPIGFIVAVHDATRNPDAQIIRYGPLKRLLVQGDTAVGTATYARLPGANSGVSDSTFQFRKSNDGWLISGFGSGVEEPLVAPAPFPDGGGPAYRGIWNGPIDRVVSGWPAGEPPVRRGLINRIRYARTGRIRR